MVKVERPGWLDEVRRAPDAVPPSATRPAPLLFDARHRPIRTAEEWARRRRELSDRWRTFLGTIEAPRAIASAKVLEEDRPDGVIRRLIRYEVEPGVPVEGYLLRPEAAGERRPAAVVFHSTTTATIRQPAGLEGPPDLHIGLQLARRGYVAFCPRCFLWEGEKRNDYLAAVERHRRRHHAPVGRPGKRRRPDRRPGARPQNVAEGSLRC